jgi:imidazolonepropionase-like amidohydrolase
VAKFFGKIGAAVAALLVFSSTEATAAPETVTVFTGCRIVANAEAPPLLDGVLVVRGRTIESIGSAAQVRVPDGAERVDCAGGTLLPGFWNSHVHFMGQSWQKADQLPVESLASQLRAMLTGYGFAHVVDTGSDLANTLALRKRIDSGEVPGPGIITAGSAYVGPNGTPFYITDTKLPELSDPAQARRTVAEAIRSGAGAIKIMSVSLTREPPFPSMPLETIRAVADEAHRSKVKLLVHPTDRAGVELAINGGADVVLHTAPIGGPWDDDLATRMVKAGLALVPTLKLWPYELAQANDPSLVKHFATVSQQQVAAFRKARGRVLFGTDVGYMSDFDPTEEYVQMAASGMSARDILAALTENPVRLFGSAENHGRLAPGRDADLVLLADDPEKDVRNFTKVRLTYRAGRRIYSSGD